MFRILNKSRIPLFLHKKSNHIFTVRQHIVLLVLRQYENKSYRMFVEWLLEAYYLRMFMQLSHIPHYTTLQKFAARISGTMLEKIISSFVVLLSNTRRLFIGIIDSSGFKLSNASQYYTDKVDLHKKYLKLSTGVEVLSQIVCYIKIRRAPRHDTKDFRPLITKISEILPPIVSICC
jgi:hypothetical protein